MKLIKFYADWCGPCKQQSKALEDFDAVPVEDVDIDQNQDKANEYSVRSIPTMILRDDEQVYESFNGITPVEEIEAVVKKYE